MAQNYFSTVTHIGRNKLVLSAAGGAAVTITHFAIGDGNGAEVNPTAASTALVREVWRTPVESVVIDPLNPSAVLVTSIIPTNAGGWWMREFGIFDVDGDMVAVAKPVSQYKPTALEGQLEDIRYEFQIIIGETANVTMLVDPSVLLASREYVETRKIPVAQLSLTPWVPVKSVSLTAPPANPAAWDAYIIPNGASGAWAGNAQKMAQWNGTAWKITTPPDGHGVSLPDGRIFVRINGVYVELTASKTFSGLIKLAADPMDFDDDKGALTPSGIRTAVVPPAGLDNLIFNSWFNHSRRFPGASRVNINWPNNAYWFDHWKNVTGQAIAVTWTVDAQGRPTLALPAGARIKIVLESPNFDAGVLSALILEGNVSAVFAGSELAPVTIPLDKTDAFSGRKYCVFDFTNSSIGPNLEITIIAQTATKIGRLKCERGKRPTFYAAHQPYIESMILDRYFQRLKRRLTITATAADQYFTDMVALRNEMMRAPLVNWNVTTMSNAKNLTSPSAYDSGVQIAFQSVAAGTMVLEYELTFDADF